jgi:hypothetical protein
MAIQLISIMTGYGLMPEDETHNVAELRVAAKKKTGKRTAGGVDFLDTTIVGGVLGALLLAVGIVGGWLPANTVTVAAMAFSRAAADGASRQFLPLRLA